MELHVSATRKNKSSKTESKLGRRTAMAPKMGADDLARIALGLFAERHFASVTIKDIARAAKINSAMIYYYYEDKEHLFRAALENAVDEAFQAYARHGDSRNFADAVEAIDAWFDVHVALYKQLRNVVKISVDRNSIIGLFPKGQDPIKRFYRHENKILQNFIREGVEKGIFRDVDPSVIATMISTSLDGAMARTFILDDFDIVGTVEEFKQAVRLYLTHGVSEAKAKRGGKGKGSRSGRKSKG